MASGEETDKKKTSAPLENQDMKIPPREKMIITAVHFLLNPKVMKDGTVIQKKAFLQSKGLTEKEISLAFERANVAGSSSGKSAYLPVAQRPVHHQSVPSVWMRINHIGSSIIILSIICYGIHRAYKLYIEPWLFGEQQKEDRLTEMENQLIELNRSLSHLRRSVGTIEDTLASQKVQLNKLCEEAIPSSELLQNPLIFNDIKSEIASIKSLFLGRQRFPPAPNVVPTIPSWQLEASFSEKKNEDDDLEMKPTEVDLEKKPTVDDSEKKPTVDDSEKKPTVDDSEMKLAEDEENVSDREKVEEGIKADLISKESVGNSVYEESSESPTQNILNSSVNGEPGNLAADDVEAYS